ncbi:MAG TPA: hypothetical protein VFB61_11620 [Gemmatimonadales bacterium]|nr:hypothetical protein [Gemmatimonadales bacterium]
MYRYTLAIALMTLAACDDSENPLAPAGDTSDETQLLQNGPLLGKIAFSMRGVGNQTDIYVMNADGTGQTRLTTAPENEFSPAWSQDNKQIAFVRPRTDGANVVHQDIFVMDANGSNGHWVSPTPNSVSLNDPSWSPDGSRIAVWTAGQDLAYLEVATGELKPIASSLGQFKGFYPSYDPSGQKIVFGGGGTLFIIDANSFGLLSKIVLPPGLVNQHPSFSPDGQKIAFAGGVAHEPGADIYVVGANGTGLTRLASSPGTESEPSWSPDGNQIAFGSDRSDVDQIYRTNVGGGRRARLGPKGILAVSPAYSH